MITRQISESEHQAYKHVPQGCTCNDGKGTVSPCRFCKELARIQFNRNEQIADH